MTDPVTNVEIEDVLSSIRRLVSENARSERREVPLAEPESARESAPVSKAAPDRDEKAETPAAGATMLLLTPAHRVSEPVQPETEQPKAVEPAEAQEASEPDLTADCMDVAPEPSGSARFDTEDTADLEAIFDAEFTEGEARDAEAPFADVPDAGFADDGLVQLVEEEIAAALGTDEQAAEPVLFSHANAREAEIDSLADRIAGLEAAVAQRDDEWEPDGESEDAYAATPSEALPWEDELPEAAMPQTSGDEHVWEAETLDEPEPPTWQEEPAEEPAASEAFIGETPEGAEFSDSQDEMVFATRDFLAGEDSVIDEEMLRELVAEIVRQELQGTLGERITRNVRKLVRREIHRALSAREFD